MRAKVSLGVASFPGDAETRQNLITIKTQLCNPELFRIDYMGRHKPIPGGSAAAVQDADAHIIDTKQLLLMRVGRGLVVIRKQNLITAADKALFRAKEAGRNRTRSAKHA